MPRSDRDAFHVQLQISEQALVDKVMRRDGGTATDALAAVNAARARRGVPELNKSTVHRYVAGRTHKRGQHETRGRKRKLSRADVRKLDQARVRLLKQADGEHRVTYEHIVDEAGLADSVCLRVAQDALRSTGVAFRHPRKKIYVSEDDAKLRLKVCRLWIKRPKSFWAEKVHCYVDNKSWVTLGSLTTLFIWGRSMGPGVRAEERSCQGHGPG